MKKKYTIVILCFIWALSGRSQDPQFSQFYAAPMYLNPAFTGNTYKYRFMGNYRHQWPSIPGAFVSSSFGFDYHNPDLKSGFGMMVVSDKAGSGRLGFTSIGGLYSYKIALSRTHFLSTGIRASHVSRSLDVSKLVFGDQLANNNGGGTNSAAPFIEERTSYMDIATGIVYYTKDHWIGAAFDHINRPNQALISAAETRLPIKYSLHGGYNIPVQKNVKGEATTLLTLAANYKGQQKWDQVDIGAYINYQPLVLGLWYRGIPIFKAYERGYQNNDALVLLLGYEVKRFRAGYSYDITISRLIANTGGSHEIAIIFEFPPPVRKRKKILIPCAKF